MQTNCIVTDTIKIDGFDNLSANFSSNNTSCLSLLDANIQFIDLSIVDPNEIIESSYWDFGDGTTLPYTYSFNPLYTYSDTGNFNVSLYLVNEGGCIDSSNLNVCVCLLYTSYAADE